MDTERIPEIDMMKFNKEKPEELKKEGVETAPQEKPAEPSKAISPSATPKLPTTKLPRCDLKSCNKKIGYTGFTCHCGQTFCATHRYAKEHGCTHNYKERERAQLEKKNGATGLAYSKVTKI